MFVDDEPSRRDFISSLGNCSHLLVLSWTPLFLYGGTSPLNNVTLLTYAVAGLLNQLCLSAAKDISTPSCVSLNGSKFIVERHLNFSFLELEESSFSALFPVGGNGVLWVWLELEVWLTNGSMLHVTSSRVQVAALVACTNDTGNGPSLPR